MNYLLSKFLSFLGTSILEKYLRYLETKVKAQTQKDVLAAEILKKQIEAELETRKLSVQIARIESGWWVTALIRPLFAYPLAFWWSAVILDSVFHFGWKIAALPSPLDEWAGWIVGMYFMSRPIEKIGRAVVFGRQVIK